MFEEFYVNAGNIRMADGTGYPVVYFAKDGTYRDANGTLQMQTWYLCKPASGTVLPERIDADAAFTDAAGREWSIRTVERLFNHFERQLEAFKLTVV